MIKYENRYAWLITSAKCFSGEVKHQMALIIILANWLLLWRSISCGFLEKKRFVKVNLFLTKGEGYKGQCYLINGFARESLVVKKGRLELRLVPCGDYAEKIFVMKFSLFYSIYKQWSFKFCQLAHYIIICVSVAAHQPHQKLHINNTFSCNSISYLQG